MHAAVHSHTHKHRLVRALAARIARVSHDLNSQNVANSLWSLCWLCSRFPGESVEIAASVGPSALRICSRPVTTGAAYNAQELCALHQVLRCAELY